VGEPTSGKSSLVVVLQLQRSANANDGAVTVALPAKDLDAANGDT